MSLYESKLPKQQDELIRKLVKTGHIKLPGPRIFQEFGELGISKRKIKRTIQEGQIYPVYYELSYPTGIRKRRGYVAELEFDDTTLLVNFKLLPTGVVVIYSAEWKGMEEELPEEELVEEELELLEPSVATDLEAELDKIGVEEKIEEPEEVSLDDLEIAPEELELELTDIPGIGPKTAEKLEAAGCSSIEDLVSADLEKLSQESGISLSKLKKCVEEAKKVM